MDTTSYESHRHEMQTGDLLAFHGTGLVSRLIQWRTKSDLNHVSMVLRLAEAGAERLLMVHATSKYGVQLLPVSRYLSCYRGEAWWVQLNHDLARQLNATYRSVLTKFLLEQTGRRYDTRGVTRFLLPWVRESQADYFCSELIATALATAGLTQATWVSPAQMVAQPCFQRIQSLV